MVTTKHVQPVSLPPCLKGMNHENYIYVTLKERCPNIIDKLVNYFQGFQQQCASKCELPSTKEIAAIVSSLYDLRYKMLTNKPLEAFDDSYSDVQVWNKALQEKREQASKDGRKNTWYETDWLFVECYLYRKIYSLMLCTISNPIHDYFFKQKCEGFKQYKTQVLSSILQLNYYISKQSQANSNVHLQTLIKQCIWGNRCDLSFSGGEVAVHDQSRENLDDLDHLLVVNDLPKVLHYIKKIKNLSTNRRMDIILDNAGMELVFDMIFAEYTLAMGLVDKVVIHMKKIPWFVSDVTMNDWRWTISAFKTLGIVGFNFARQLESRIKEKSLELQLDSFWVTPHPFHLMKQEAPKLYSSLSKSHLLIFKGDLNYRKLIADHEWDYTTSFKTALRGFEPAPILALRTMKCATVCGLSEPKAQLLHEEYNGSKEWLVDGKHAVLQFNE